jgi:hypothetical protein
MKVSILVDIQTLSIAVASASIVIAVVYYILQIQHQKKMRQTDLMMRLYATWGSEDMQKAAWAVMELQYEDYNDYVKKYGSSGTLHNVAVYRVGWFFNGIGVLVQSQLADIKLVNKLFGYMVTWLWEIMKPMVEGARKQFNQPKSLEWFEYLYNEVKKREQRGVNNG